MGRVQCGRWGAHYCHWYVTRVDTANTPRYVDIMSGVIVLLCWNVSVYGWHNVARLSAARTRTRGPCRPAPPRPAPATQTPTIINSKMQSSMSSSKQSSSSRYQCKFVQCFYVLQEWFPPERDWAASCAADWPHGRAAEGRGGAATPPRHAHRREDEEDLRLHQDLPRGHQLPRRPGIAREVLARLHQTVELQTKVIRRFPKISQSWRSP